MEISFSPNHLPLGPREIIISYLHDFLEVLTLIAEAYSVKDWNYLKSIYKEILYLDYPTPLAINEELYLYLDKKFKNVRQPVNFFQNIFIDIDANDPKWDFSELTMLSYQSPERIREVTNTTRWELLDRFSNQFYDMVDYIRNRTISFFFINVRLSGSVMNMLNNSLFERDTIIISRNEVGSWNVIRPSGYIRDSERLNQLIDDPLALDSFLRNSNMTTSDVKTLSDISQKSNLSEVTFVANNYQLKHELLDDIRRIKSKIIRINTGFSHLHIGIVIENNNIMIYISQSEGYTDIILDYFIKLKDINLVIMVPESEINLYVSKRLGINKVKVIPHYHLINVEGDQLQSLYSSGLIELLTKDKERKFPVLESGRIVYQRGYKGVVDNDNLVPSIMWPAITERTMMKEILTKMDRKMVLAGGVDWFYTELLDF